MYKLRDNEHHMAIMEGGIKIFRLVDTNSGESVGTFVVPENVTGDQLAKEWNDLHKMHFDDATLFFDRLNRIGAKRVYIHDVLFEEEK